jgi:hypothetical protein
VRLSAALRENLKRRKQQARDRAAAGERGPDRNSSDSELSDEDAAEPAGSRVSSRLPPQSER